jgi:hypothetical protein
MRIPLFLSANPERASRSGIIRLTDGEWVVAGDDLIDSVIEIAAGDDPFTILAQPRMSIPIGVQGPAYVLGFIEKKGTEKFFSVHATRVERQLQ